MAVVAGRAAEARAIRRDSICEGGRRLALRIEKGELRVAGRTLAVAGAKCGRIEKQLASVFEGALVLALRSVVGYNSR